MKKWLVVVVAVSVFVLLYFLTGQQKNALEQQANVQSSNADQSDSNVTQKISQQNNSIEIKPVTPAADADEVNSPAKKLAPELQRALEKMLNTSSEGLVEEKTDKSTGVDLKGRFHTAPVATINEKGEVEIQDYSIAPSQVNE